MENKSILIITESMMPYCSSWGSVQRVYNYALEFTEAGYDVSVICKKEGAGIESKDVDKIHVTGIGGETDAKNAFGHDRKGFWGILRQIKRNNKFVACLFTEIDRFVYSEPKPFAGKNSKHWAKESLPFVLQYIKKNKIGIVILSGPKFGMFYFVEDIKRSGVKIVLDYRDPWNLWYERWSLSYRNERKAIRLADLIIASTDSLAGEIRNRFQSANVKTVLNGYDDRAWKRQENVESMTHDKMVLSYIGSISINSPMEYRTPKTFLEVARRFIQEHSDVSIKFVGVTDELSLIEKDLKTKIQFVGPVPLDESLTEMRKSDVLLVFHTAHDASGKYIICGKLYDYLRSGKYVLSVGDRAESNEQFIKTMGMGIHCSNDRREIYQALNKLYAMWKDGSLHISADADEVVKFSRNYQNKKFLKYIEKI